MRHNIAKVLKILRNTVSQTKVKKPEYLKMKNWSIETFIYVGNFYQVIRWITDFLQLREPPLIDI